MHTCTYNIVIQWNLSIMDTLGTTGSVLIKEVSLCQRSFCTLLYVAGTTGSVRIREVSLFRRSLIERFLISIKMCSELSNSKQRLGLGGSKLYYNMHKK